MSKSPHPGAFLIAVRQPDETDHTYAILVDRIAEAISVVTAREPGGPRPRHVGTLGPYSVKRIKLRPGEARII